LTSEPPVPVITPLTVVERLLLPTVSRFEPSWKVPSPSIEPAVIPAVDRAEMSNTPPALAMKRAFPPVALSANPVIPPALVIIVALPAVLALRKKRFAWLPTIKVGALEELLTMPAPVMLIDVKRPSDVAKL
jgi:hypothetical protein